MHYFIIHLLYLHKKYNNNVYCFNPLLFYFHDSSLHKVSISIFYQSKIHLRLNLERLQLKGKASFCIYFKRAIKLLRLDIVKSFSFIEVYFLSFRSNYSLKNFYNSYIRQKDPKYYCIAKNGV